VPQVDTGHDIAGVVPDVERSTNPFEAPLAIESKLDGMVMD
jgi:hypothetical protein